MSAERIVDYVVVITLIIILLLVAVSMGANLVEVFKNLTSYAR